MADSGAATDEDSHQRTQVAHCSSSSSATAGRVLLPLLQTSTSTVSTPLSSVSTSSRHHRHLTNPLVPLVTRSSGDVAGGSHDDQQQSSYGLDRPRPVRSRAGNEYVALPPINKAQQEPSGEQQNEKRFFTIPQSYNDQQRRVSNLRVEIASLNDGCESSGPSVHRTFVGSGNRHVHDGAVVAGSSSHSHRHRRMESGGPRRQSSALSQQQHLTAITRGELFIPLSATRKSVPLNSVSATHYRKQQEGLQPLVVAGPWSVERQRESLVITSQPRMAGDACKYEVELTSGEAQRRTTSSIICRECGRCRCAACTTQSRRGLPSCWLCCRADHGCLCSTERTVDALSCMCCVKACLYHQEQERQGEGGTVDIGDVCSCEPPGCCARWACLGLASVMLPCLYCYWPLRGCAALSEECYTRHQHRLNGAVNGCRCGFPRRRTPGHVSPPPSKALLEQPVSRAGAGELLEFSKAPTSSLRTPFQGEQLPLPSGDCFDAKR